MKIVGLPTPKVGQIIISERGAVKGVLCLIPEGTHVLVAIQDHTALAKELGPGYGAVNYDLEIYNGPNQKRTLLRRIRVKRGFRNGPSIWKQTWPIDKQLDPRVEGLEWASTREE